MKKPMLALASILLLGACSKARGPAAEPGGGDAGRRGSATVSYAQDLRHLQGKEVVARGHILDAEAKGYPRLFENTREGRFFLVSFEARVDLAKYLNHYVEVRGTVVGYPPGTTAPSGLPRQGYDEEHFLISGASIRDVP